MKKGTKAAIAASAAAAVYGVAAYGATKALMDVAMKRDLPQHLHGKGSHLTGEREDEGYRAAQREAAQKLGTEPAKTMVLEDSYNGVRAGAAGGFVTVMVPDLSPATDEMRRIYTCECASLHEVRRKLEGGEL